MSSNNTQAANGGIFIPLLTVLFIGLKLCHVIDWSWWWVLSPIWISCIVVFVIIAVGLIILSIFSGKK